jgi:hypothetical protein
MRNYGTTPFACLILAFVLFSGGFASAEDPTVQNVDNPWLVLRAFLVSYPDDISAVDYDSEMKDWFITVNAKRLYWAGGRLLPKDEVTDKDKWRAYVDYLYPERIPDPSDFSQETIEQLDAEALAEIRGKSPVYHVAFYDALYDGATRRKIEAHITRFDYLAGLRVSVHERMVEPLKRVEKRVNDLAEKDPEVKEFLSTLSSIEGYNWRDIVDTPSRSQHSWGIAVDVLPKGWQKKNVYWNWVTYFNSKWMLVPLERRWMPPLAVVEAFEAEGFIWGGKWLLWDTMHFEYRPELLVLQKWGHSGDLGR